MHKRPSELRVPISTAPIIRGPLRVLSLTGGGYRGLFTASVLAQIVRRLKTTAPLHQALDVFAGTSIGGLIACGLAVGRSPTDLVDAIERHGPAVFPRKRGANIQRLAIGPIYDSEALGHAIDDCLGEHAKTPICEVKAGLAVCAIWIASLVAVEILRESYE